MKDSTKLRLQLAGLNLLLIVVRAITQSLPALGFAVVLFLAIKCGGGT